jgi:CRISPR-associated protein (TIGR03984 family)
VTEIKWERVLIEQPTRASDVTPVVAPIFNLQTWLESEAKTHGLRWLLAHADDGIIWGKVDAGGALLTSHEAAKGNGQAEAVCPPLRLMTLQQARLFSAQAELLAWRDGDNALRARLIADVEEGGEAHESPASPPDWARAFDEPQLLWGTRGVALTPDFTLLEDSAQGLRHAVPLSMNGMRLPAQLCVRHYLAREDFARVVVSRLVALTWKE